MIYNDTTRILGHVHVNMSRLIEVHGCSVVDNVAGFHIYFMI